MQSYYVIFVTEVGLLTFTRFHLKFQFRTVYSFIRSIYFPFKFYLRFILYDYTLVGFNPLNGWPFWGHSPPFYFINSLDFHKI